MNRPENWTPGEIEAFYKWVSDHPALRLTLAKMFPKLPTELEKKWGWTQADAEQLARQHLPPRGSSLGTMPRSLAALLGGNPFYVSRVVNALQPGTGTGDDVWWAAYLHEVAGGGLYRSVASILAGLFPALDERRTALEAAYHFCRTGGGALAARSSNAYVAGRLRGDALRRKKVNAPRVKNRARNTLLPSIRTQV